LVVGSKSKAAFFLEDECCFWRMDFLMRMVDLNAAVALAKIW
jgi:hypothetical protein